MIQQWENAWPVVKEHWHECSVEFTCVCGQSSVFLDDESGKQACKKCGREYRMFQRLEVSWPSPGVSAEGAAWAMEDAARAQAALAEEQRGEFTETEPW